MSRKTSLKKQYAAVPSSKVASPTLDRDQFETRADWRRHMRETVNMTAASVAATTRTMRKRDLHKRQLDTPQTQRLAAMTAVSKLSRVQFKDRKPVVGKRSKRGHARRS